MRDKIKIWASKWLIYLLITVLAIQLIAATSGILPWSQFFISISAVLFVFIMALVMVAVARTIKRKRR